MFWNKKEYLVDFQFDSDKGTAVGKVIISKRLGFPKMDRLKESIKELIIDAGIEPTDLIITGINII